MDFITKNISLWYITRKYNVEMLYQILWYLFQLWYFYPNKIDNNWGVCLQELSHKYCLPRDAIEKVVIQLWVIECCHSLQRRVRHRVTNIIFYPNVNVKKGCLWFSITKIKKEKDRSHSEEEKRKNCKIKCSPFFSSKAQWKTTVENNYYYK